MSDNKIKLFDFVTAKLQGTDDCRQGWLVNFNPVMIQFQNGDVAVCEKDIVKVTNPPELPVYDEQ